MGTQQARVVKAHISSKGVVEEIDDPFYHHFWDPDTRLDRAVGEEHYGWVLKPLLDKGITLAPVFPGAVDICVNDPDDTTHLNTIASQQPELVKLDVGYWGDYTRQGDFMKEPQHGPPQRNFGMIQGRDVWLCNFMASGSASNTDEPDKDSPAGKFLANLRKNGADAEFIFHAIAPCTSFTGELDANKVYLLFSDLHLPERFPDAPRDDARPKASDGLPLRTELMACQHEFGLLSGNDMDGKRAGQIQGYLEGTFTDPQDRFPVSDSGYVRNKQFSRDNVRAEKAILDRTIKGRSCWFYRPLPGNSEEGNHEEKANFSELDASAAIELAMFLAAVRATQKGDPDNKVDPADVQVIQLGDLYELWMGREFLYLDFPVTSTFDMLSLPRLTLGLLTSFIAGENDDFQIRLDEDWSDGKLRHAIKRYPFHQFKKSDMIKRHKTGWSYFADGAVDYARMAAEGVTGEIVSRIQARLSDRSTNVEQFSLPVPSDGADATLRKMLTAAGYSLDDFKRDPASADDVSQVTKDEFLWHKLVFTMFNDSGFDNIHGNHDGYRSDPVLKGSVGIAAKEWISIPGIWIEHGHRWDEFNRDGCAIGAGMTNMVYYHNMSMLKSDGGKTKEWIMPQDQKCFMPGAAQWYLLVNMTNLQFKGREGTPVFPFGIIVMGHTHHPDLCYIRYEKEGGWDVVARALEGAAEAVMEVVGALGAAALAAPAAILDEANQLAGDVRHEGGVLVDKAKDAAGKAADEAKSLAGDAENKIKSLF